MSKIINFVFMLISSIVIIALVYSMSDLYDSFGLLLGVQADLNSIVELINTSTLEEIMQLIASLGLMFFLIFGFPVIVFLVSMNGLRKN